MNTTQQLNHIMQHSKSAYRAAKRLLRLWPSVLEDRASFSAYAQTLCDALAHCNPFKCIRLLRSVRAVRNHSTAPCCDLFAAVLPYCTKADTIAMLSAMLQDDIQQSLTDALLANGDRAVTEARFEDAYRSFFAALHTDVQADSDFIVWCCVAAAMQCGRYDTVADLFTKKALTTEPLDLPPALRGFEAAIRIEVLLAAQQAQEAAAQLQLLLSPEVSADSLDPHLQPTFARTMAALGNLTEAAECWQTAAAHCPHCAVRYLQNAADLYRQARQFDRAIVCYQRIRTLPVCGNEACAESWVSEGLCQYVIGNSAEELVCYGQALLHLEKNDAACIRPLCFCADTEFRIGRADEANAHYHRALELTLLHKNLQRTAEIECEWADHIRECIHRPDLARPHYTNAIRIYRRLLHAVDVRKALAMTYNGRSICCFNEKNYRGQISDTTAAISIFREMEQTPDVCIRLSTCLRNRGDSWDRLKKMRAAGNDYAEALAVYKQACEQDPSLQSTTELPELLLCCGRISEQLELYTEAGMYYGELLTLLEERPAPPSDETIELTALALIRRGHAFLCGNSRAFTRALADFDQAIALTNVPKQPALLRLHVAALRQRGEVLAAMEQVELAAQSFAEADRLQKALHDAVLPE